MNISANWIWSDDGDGRSYNLCSIFRRDFRLEAVPAEAHLAVCADSGYQTPKVDTRAAIFSGDRILLVREKDGRWALPGGWCEFDLAPAANTVKEVREEAGREVKVTSLIAVQNRNDHNTPPYVYGVVKLFYLCEELGGEFRENSETTTADYFAADDLPPLAEEKCNADQVLMCFRAHKDPDMRTVFD